MSGWIITTDKTNHIKKIQIGLTITKKLKKIDILSQIVKAVSPFIVVVSTKYIEILM
jgi:hypothetical protein